MAAPETDLTFAEAYAYMKEEVLKHAAGGCAVAGTVGGRPMIFGITEQPPRIVQVQPIDYEGKVPLGLTATVTSVGVSEDNAPIVELGRYASPLPDNTQAIFETALDGDQTNPVRLGGGRAPWIFDIVFWNITIFS